MTARNPIPDAAAVERARITLAEAAAAMVAGVGAALPAWVESQVARILDAWDPPVAVRDAALAAARVAGRSAAERVAHDLVVLFDRPVREQRATPLQIVRSAYREPTAVLRSAGVPPVVRDDVAERIEPDDVYGLAIRTFADIGRADLGPVHLAWGLAKTTVMRAETAN